MSVTVRQLAEWANGIVVGDETVPIRAARPLSEAGPGDVTFVEGDRNLTTWHNCNAAAAFVTKSVTLNGRPLIQVADPLLAFATVVMHLRGERTPSANRRIDPSASIHPTATIGDDSTIGAYVVVGEGAVIGARCHLYAGTSVGRFCRLAEDVVLHPHVVVYDDCVLGNRVMIHANSVIGADGFGYRLQGGKHIKVPQLGNVEIGDDVEIGAGTTIDRGTFGPTRIGAGTKIDNLVQIGHNCQIGRHNLIVSQVGIAGSCTTGDYVVMAGQVGIGDHVNIGEKATLGAKAGVAQDVPANARLLGSPALPDREQIKIWFCLAKLPELRKDFLRMKRHLGLGEPTE